MLLYSPSPAVSHFPALWVKCSEANLHQFLALFLKEARGNSVKSHFLPTTGSARSLSGSLFQPSPLSSQHISGLQVCFSTQQRSAHPWKGGGTESVDGRGEARCSAAIPCSEGSVSLKSSPREGKGNGDSISVLLCPVGLSAAAAGILLRWRLRESPAGHSCPAQGHTEKGCTLGSCA